MERASQYLAQTTSAVLGFYTNRLYTNLNPEKEEIRLATILPGTGRDPLRCTLQVSSFSQKRDALNYQALSYTWGDPHATNEILLNGGPFPVTSNLYAALHRLRCPNTSRTIWIDAICINQSDVEERNHQVQIMRKIFLLASEVLVFLDDYKEGTDVYCYQELHDPLPRRPLSLRGSSSPGISDSQPSSSDWELKAVELLHLLASIGEEAIFGIDVFHTVEKLKEESDELPSELKAIATWFSSKWWSRVWVVQEITVPEHASLICGPYLVSWVTVASAAANLYRSSLRHDFLSITNLSPVAFAVMRNIYTRVLELESTRVVRTHGRDLGALEVLWTYRHRHASDTRDHIYGLIGLLPGHFSVAGITPQYELEDSETFTKVTVSLLRTSRSLAPLIGAWRRAPDRKNLPSWVQDWSYSWPDESYSGLHQFLALHKLFRACRPDIGLPGAVMHMAYARVDGPALNLRGAELDIICEVGETMHKSDAQQDIVFQDLMLDWLQLAQSHLFRHNYGKFNPNVVENFWRTIRFDLEFRYEGRILGLRGPDVFRRLSDSDIPDADSLLERLQDIKPADFAIVKLLNLDRRFFVTKAGRMGLGPHTTQPGDKIFVLWGGDVPFILRANTERPHERECPQDTTETCMTLVGDCYLHGVMDGGRELWGTERMVHLH
ncbi:heterokaryon incompatibility protein-domain-containing protein [Lophiotrema nucula]|uniref:Heterokaryon incompatibility protein-domain-containing protein n=1 Tax=Lophiotrema nucula TaxID=690887 RepID=A0A6A5YQW5_9PLEO|nr:heterokaryon incompatibility protein-domain-containing protein [Lophiotrema nucula]